VKIPRLRRAALICGLILAAHFRRAPPVQIIGHGRRQTRWFRRTLLSAIHLLGDNQTVFYFDPASKMTPVGNSWKGLGPDRLHLLQLWVSEMEPLLAKLIAGNQ